MSNKQAQSKTGRIIRASGDVRDESLPAPARWVVQLVQRLIAILIIMIGESFRAIFKGKRGRRRQE